MLVCIKFIHCGKCGTLLDRELEMGLSIFSSSVVAPHFQLTAVIYSGCCKPVKTFEEKSRKLCSV